MKPQTKSYKAFIFKTSMAVLVLAFVTMLVCSYVYGVKSLDPAYYGSYYYSWARLVATKTLFMSSSFVPLNKFKASKEIEDFISQVQNKSGDAEVNTGYLSFNFPEHYPRDYMYQYTLSKPEYIDFLKLRQKIIQFIITANDTNGVEFRTDKNKHYFGQVVVEAPDFHRKIFADDENMKFARAIDGMCDIAGKVLKRTPNYGFSNGQVTPDLLEDIRTVIGGFYGNQDHFTTDEINNFFLMMGNSYPSVPQSFLHSRLVYLFIFASANIDLSNVMKTTIGNTKESRIKWEYERCLLVNDMFAQVFGRLYPEGINRTESFRGNFLTSYLRSYFGPSHYTECIAEEKDIANFIEAVKNNVTAPAPALEE